MRVSPAASPRRRWSSSPAPVIASSRSARMPRDIARRLGGDDAVELPEVEVVESEIVAEDRLDGGVLAAAADQLGLEADLVERPQQAGGIALGAAAGGIGRGRKQDGDARPQ